jgi:RNA recognition motif-containing protein
MRADVLQNAQGRSKGAGIVLFEKQEDAQKAIKEFDQTLFAGRLIYVREDKFAY